MFSGIICKKRGIFVTGHIVFTGHFDIGEKLTDLQLQMVEDSRDCVNKTDSRLAVFVGDIGLPLKIFAYMTSGIEELKNIYRFRKEQADCDGSQCMLQQLPDENRLSELIDTDQYEAIIDWLSRIHPELYNNLTKLASSGVEPGEDTAEGKNAQKVMSQLTKVTREEIVPKMVAERIDQYRLNDVNVLTYSERDLRNRVMQRTKTKARAEKKKTWRQINDFAKEGRSVRICRNEIVNNRGNPVCRGIMLALFEKVVGDGYTSIDSYYSENQKSAVIQAQSLFQIVSKKLPHLKTNNVNFNNRFY